MKTNSEIFKPMLAHKFGDYQDGVRFPVYSQPKLDGIRCITTRAGMFSRNGNEIISAPHILESLKPFFASNPSAILDGELYADKLSDDFNKICSLVKRTKPTAEDLRESASTIEYWIYDAPVIGRLTEADPFACRFNLIRSMLCKISKIRIVETEKVLNAESLDTLFSSYLEQGYEGQMVRRDACYENKRSRSLLKRKEFIDDEFSIIDITEGEGKRTGTAGFMSFVSRNGREFNSNIKGNFQYLKAILEDKKKLIGKMATVKFFNLTPNGVPRFPYVTAIRDYE